MYNVCIYLAVSHAHLGYKTSRVYRLRNVPCHVPACALTSGTLGTACYWIASYAVIHFIVFVRKMLL